jgi:nucleoid-associated protein YgaU
MTRLRGLLAIGVLAGILGGLPWALVRFGNWPISGMPTGDQLRDLGDAVVSDTAVFGVLTLAAWLVWALFVASFLVEARAAFQGVQAPRIAIAGPAQRAARLLVATVVLGVTVQRAMTPASALPATPAPSTLLVAHQEQPTEPDMTTAPTPSALTAPAPGVVITVTNGDSAWSLAEQHLGDGMRWRELWEANRSVMQPDGRTWFDPQVIRPGWQLRLPTGGSVPSTNGHHVVERGDTLSEIAAEELGDPHRYPEIFDLNVGDVQPDGRRLEDPNLILPGWELEIPADPLAPVPLPLEPETAESEVAPPAPTPVPSAPPLDPPDEAVPPTPVPAAPTSPTTNAEPPGEGKAADAGNGWSIASTTLLGVGGALATGLAVRVRRLRRRRAVRGEHGHSPLANALSTTEAAILAAADVPLVRWAGQSIAQLVQRLDHRSMSAGPVAVEISEETGIEILWEQPQRPAPEPWRVADGGWAWRLPYDPEAAVPTAELPAAIPALVTIGQREGRQLLLDLEAYGAVSVTGPPDRRDAFLRSVALELASSEEFADTDVVVVGIDAGMTTLDRLTATTLESAVSVLARTSEEVATSLARAKRSNTFSARTGGHVPIEATVVIASGLSDVEVRTLIETSTARSGVAVVVATGEGVAPAHIEIGSDGGARLLPLDIEFDPCGLAETTANDVDDLLRELGSDVAAPVDRVIDVRVDNATQGEHEPDDLSTSNGHAAVEAAFDELFPEPTPDRCEPAMVVHVLGAPSVPDRPEIGRRELILTTYLACREGPVAASAVQDALWGGKPVETKTVWNVIGATRRALGDLEDGSPAMPAADRSRGGSLQLAAGVTTDLAILRRLVSEADGASSSEAITLLREGLSLVTGPPFDAVGYDWAYRDQDVAEASTLIEQAAERLVELALEADQVDIAREAVVRGLRGLPGNEELYRCRMRVEHHAGNLPGVTAAYEELVAYLDDLETEPSPATSALFHELARPAGRR